MWSIRIIMEIYYLKLQIAFPFWLEETYKVTSRIMYEILAYLEIVEQ